MISPSSPRRLLFLLPTAPRLDAPHGGARTSAQFLLAMARRHHVAVLYLRDLDEPRADPLIERACALVEDTERRGWTLSSGDRWRRRARLLIGYARGQPLWATDWAVPAFARRLHALAQCWRPDIVHIEHHIMGQYVAALRCCTAPRILTEHEPGTPAAREQYHAARGLGRMYHGLDLLAWRRFERAVLREVQAVVALTERDRRELQDMYASVPIVRIPVGAPVPRRPLDPLGQPPPSVLFVGNYAHPPNVGAALRLAQAIFPRVRAHHPDARLFLVGDRPTPAIQRLASDSVFVTGRVPDVTPYLNRAAVVAAPLSTGGGMRVKVLEAIVAGKALVASRRAVAGLDLTPGDAFLVAETDAEVAVAITGLLADPQWRAALGGRAWRWARDHLGWDATVRAYERLYAALDERGDGWSARDGPGGAGRDARAGPGGDQSGQQDRATWSS